MSSLASKGGCIRSSREATATEAIPASAWSEAPASAVTAAVATASRCQLLQLWVDFLLRFHQHLDQLARLLPVVSSEEGVGRPSAVTSTRSPDPVHVVLRTVGVIVVDHHLDVVHVWCATQILAVIAMNQWERMGLTLTRMTNALSSFEAHSSHSNQSS